MNITGHLFAVVESLQAAGIEHALCGGLAVVVHGYPRLTRDIDLLIRADDLGRVRSALADIGFSLDSGILPFDVGKPTERRIFRVSKVEGDELVTVDLILTNDFLEDVWGDREALRVGDRNLVVVSRSGLAKMKRAAGRPQDLADLAGLGIGDP